MLITIFTPTYNRGYIINRLYKSLCVQIKQNFEWIVVDDGSTDETERIFKQYSDNNAFRITYIKKCLRGGQASCDK